MYRDARGRLHFSNAPANPGYAPYAPRTAGFPAMRFYSGYSYGGRNDSASSRARRKALDPIICEVASRHRVDPALVKAVIRTESDFISYARSPEGCARADAAHAGHGAHATTSGASSIRARTSRVASATCVCCSISTMAMCASRSPPTMPAMAL